MISPFCSERYLGTVSHVNAGQCILNLPYAASSNGKFAYGAKIKAGVVGEFVLIELKRYAILGKLVNVKVPESERKSVEVDLGESIKASPLGIVQLLSAYDLITNKFLRGIPEYPRVGASVFSAHPEILLKLSQAEAGKSFQLGTLPDAGDAILDINVGKFVGRHGVILGTTGGGKSWTTTTVLEGLCSSKVKTILIDPTGEYHTLKGSVKNLHLGECDSSLDSTKCHFPYTSMSEQDLFGIFQPSSASQVPKLRDAIKSLKLAKLEPSFANNEGVVIKANKPRRPFEKATYKNRSKINSNLADFDISKLSRQIAEECVWPTGNPETNWGRKNDATVGYNVSLISRVDSILSEKSLDCIFDTSSSKNLITEIESFLESNDQILRISVESLSFEYNAREITANAIGRYLLSLARQKKFKDQPLVLILDEAHQFMDKNIGNEFSQVKLDSFSLIAKEGRKYGLNVTLTTQRSRDIPEDVLSQIGTFFVHRLINEADIRVIERACGEIDRKVIEFLPTLAQGEGILIGVDFPIPLKVKVKWPESPPDSSGPEYN